MASATPLSEPMVLAHTKDHLFSDSTESNTYAVVDTQFAVDEWLSGRHIPSAVRERLAPFNRVELGSGFPDLIGVCSLGPELLAVERFGERSPLIAVEAKGDTDAATAAVESGIIQAYDRLHQANAAYVTAPVDAVSQTDRALARELNVGVLGVDPGGTVTPLEVPRVVGNRTSDDATAIRFQATAHGVAGKSFTLNHPKNYLGYPLALYHSDDTAAVFSEYVINAVESARRGAAFLGLVKERPSGVVLTPLGEEVIRFAFRRYESVTAALASFKAWNGSRRRFCELAPEWGLLTRRVVWAYPATQLLVTELQTMHDDGFTTPSLVDLVEWLHVTHPTFTVELFLRGTEDVRRRVLDVNGDLRSAVLKEGEVFHSPTVFQLKAILYHAGILTERGAEPHRLEPVNDVWKLREPLDTTLE
ncbi:hypothetical protein [Halocatena pleomorpha]|uniref:Uncharacterized protein n=1 Tax=Halocatena pleomorpha TaxID=1785090 RepID=A0A3P3RAN4_9EURY|nr:hypothetical protein [Halocatena pleomorpha]RRJ30541.1 hypothetical protein EIK79_09680 [Halocatena pleomorpha]